jgi:N-acetylmuramoyl-L-alanine amidase
VSMSKSRSIEIDDEQGRQGKRKYRLNKRKFAATMSVLCFIIVGTVLAIHYVGDDSEREAIAAVDPPQKTVTAAPRKSSEPATQGLKGKSIVVDAGHGGFDPGASGASGSEEDDINLAVAQFLKAEFEDRGAEVIMTRSDENAIAGTKAEDMEKRRVIIHDSGSDIMVSVHMNWFKDDSVSGPLVLFMPGSDQGKVLAECIQQHLNDDLEPDTKGSARSDNLLVLRAGSQPSVLVECGFISNPQEEEKLLTEDYQRKVAKAICDGVADFING